MNGWQSARSAGKPLGFTLPPSFVQDTAVRFMHGGQRWTDGSRDFSIEYGYWDPHSFGPSVEVRWCRMAIAGASALVARSERASGRHEVALWLRDISEKDDSPDSPDPLFVGSSSRRDDDSFGPLS
jgi:hypothetical protein